MLIKNKKLFKSAAIFMLLVFLNQILFPTIALALTAGPNSPEAASFEPVAATDLVSVFSGDFTYNLPVVNIPGPDGAGYSMSLSYHSGVSSEEEASWVGYGWTLNPGAINRQMRGLPDDYKGNNVKKYNKTRPNWSAGIREEISLEIASKDDDKEKTDAQKKEAKDKQKLTGSGIGMNGQLLSGAAPPSTSDNESGSGDGSGSSQTLSLGYSRSVRFNNFMGITKTHGFSVGFNGMGSLGMNTGGGQTTFSANVSPALLLSGLKKAANKLRNNNKNQQTDIKDNNKLSSTSQTQPSKSTNQNLKNFATKSGKNTGLRALSQLTSTYGLYSFSNFESATNVVPYKGKGFNWSFSIEVNPSQLPIGVHGGYSGNYNIQINEPEKIMHGYGYMYNPDKTIYETDTETFNNADNSNVLSDYYVEKDGGYDKNDYFLGIPFNNADNFSMSGEGISGGFKLWHENIGHYYPNFVESKQLITQMGMEVSIGVNLGLGMDFGVGFQSLAVEDWKFPLLMSNNVPQYDMINPGFMRMSNDLGGSVRYTSATAVESATITDNIGVPGTIRHGVNTPSLNTVDKVTAGGSSYMQYSYYDNTGNIMGGERIEKNNSTVNQYTNIKPPNTIFEVAVINEGGMRYVYGLPVYTRNEKSVSIGVNPNDPNIVIENNYLVYQKPTTPVSEKIDVATPSNNKIVVGEERPEPYANTFLLTQINTPDYVDIGNDGPDDKDFGGWTRFNYRRNASTSAFDWYAYRTPYTGLLYQAGQISDRKDDMGSVSSGEKEIYYLKTVETKTHVAFFITNETNGDEFASYLSSSNLSVAKQNTVKNYLDGSKISRNDGLGADKTNDPCVDKTKNDASKKLEKLERIVIYSKERFQKPLQIVNFQYDYSLVKGIPNTLAVDYNQSGKLTLKRVWFENEGIVKSKIAPYEFVYAYKSSYKQEVMARYPSILNNNNFTDNKQNPDYKPHHLDMWGNYQDNGAQRNALQKPWVSQENRDGDWDPAAWQLKQIILPSGGEIHIQYEQKDYKFVQDRDALAMVSLLPGTIDDDDPESTKYYLNLTDIGITSAQDKQALMAKLEKYFTPDKPDYMTQEDYAQHEHLKKRIYFKFLYSLKGSAPDLDQCRSEYITGYTVVNKVGEENGEIYLSLGSPAGLFANPNNKKNIPKQVCYDYVLSQKGGFLENNDCTHDMFSYDSLATELMAAGSDNCIFDNNECNGKKFKKDVVRAALTKMTLDVNYIQPKRKDICKEINLNLSYLRIPTLYAKKGGGVRVKRLLMYDPGFENESGSAVLFGSEYIYENEDGTSSGVTTNEPAAGREENALINLIPKKQRGLLGRAVAGRDKEQNEGPIGESILPGPSVGHSRIVIKNIHTGKTGTGFQIHEFFTAKDYPFDKQYDTDDIKGRGVDNTDIKDNKKRDWMSIPAGMFNYSVNKRWMAQGYRFIINSMHGQNKRVSSYGGDYDSNSFGDPNNSNHYLSSSTKYTFFEPGEKIPMIKYHGDTSDTNYQKFTRTYETPGVEEDVAMYMKSINDINMDFSLEIDVTIGLSWTPPIFLNFGLSFSYDEKEMNTHAMSKVLRYPAIMKNIENYQDGVTHLTEYLAFNPDNGQPVVTRSTDGYDGLILAQSTPKHNGSVYNWDIPASWVYDDFRQKASSITPENRTNQLNLSAGTITSYGTVGDWLTNKFTNNEWEPHLPANYPVGVLSASMQKYDDQWFSLPDILTVNTEYGIDTILSFEKDKLDAKWRLAESYVYKTNRTSSDHNVLLSATERIYNGGVFDEPLPMFDWNANTQVNGSNGNWIKTNEITKYSPNGNALEERNVLGIYSTAKFGYRHTQPIMIIQNANYESVHFESFEEGFDTTGEAHSGFNCLDYRVNPNHKFIDALFQGTVLTQQLKDKGANVKIWVKHGYGPNNPHLENTTANFSVNVNGIVSVPFKKIASTGEWTLYGVDIFDWQSITIGTALNIKLNYNVDVSGGEYVYMDDFRFQPYNAEAVCYVYDKASLKPMAQFDDQHFGVFYQYNDEGKLVRKMIETERGMKTLQENQYNTPLKNRFIQ